MNFNIFSKKVSNVRKLSSDKDSKDKYVKVDVNAYNENNRVKISRPPIYSFNGFMEDIDRVLNPTTPKNTEIIDI